MFGKRTAKFLVLVAVLVTVPLSAVAVAAKIPDPAMTSRAADDTLVVEVAEDTTRFVLDMLNPHEDGMPAYGNPFITQGYIYPEGTLDGSNGVLPSGEPEFPDQVLGEWTCYGWFIGDGAYTESGEAVVSTQVFKFYGEDGDSTMVSNGFELAEIGAQVTRVLAGGTGTYQGTSGIQVQELLGFTDAMGVNLRVAFQLEG